MKLTIKQQVKKLADEMTTTIDMATATYNRKMKLLQKKCKHQEAELKDSQGLVQLKVCNVCYKITYRSKS
jgi:hypothetical protein